MRIKKRLFLALFFAVLILLKPHLPKDFQNALFPISPTPIPTIAPSLQVTEAKVKKVIDGDTIELDSGQLVRYIGIDTPETKHPTKSKQCFGNEAHEENKKLVEGKQVRLVRDVSEVDRYNRLLRYVYVSTQASPSGILVNDYLTRNGYALASTFPPDVAFSEHFINAQKEARQNKRGLWTSCSTSSE